MQVWRKWNEVQKESLKIKIEKKTQAVQSALDPLVGDPVRKKKQEQVFDLIAVEQGTIPGVHFTDDVSRTSWFHQIRSFRIYRRRMSKQYTKTNPKSFWKP